MPVIEHAQRCLAFAARAAFAGLVLLLLGACANISSVAGPSPAFDLDKDIADLQAHYAYSTSIPDYYSKLEHAQDEKAKRALRDEFVVGRLTLYNLQYIKFISQFTISRAALDSAVDIAKLGVDLATTMTGTAETKSILGAVSAGLTGSRLSIEKNFFEEKTAQALVAQMNAGRKAALVPIVQGLGQDSTQYPLSTAIVDLYSYYEAGTLEGAVQGIQEGASATEAKANIDIEKFRTVTFGADYSTDRIHAWLYPGYKSFTPDGLAVDAGGKEITPVDANVTALRDWLSQHYGALPLGTFLNNGAFAAARKQAMSDLHIP